jgi:hypothetical protein
MHSTRLWIGLSFLAGLLIITVFAVIGFWAIFALKPARLPVSPTGVWEVTVIAAPTMTPVITLVVPENPQSLTPTPPAEGEVGVGVYAQIYNTGGEGLRLRAEPGKSGTPLFLGMDSEVFLVKDGPREADNYIWWFLEAPYDKNRSGWAVQDYLRVIENP